MSTSNDPTVAELSHLFAMPITALIDADAHAAACFAEFVKSQGFEPDPNNVQGGLGKMRMMSFTYDRQKEDGSTETVRMQVPLLSMLTLPALGIQDATVRFGVNVVKTVAESTASRALSTGTSTQTARNQVPALLGRIAAPSSSTTTKQSMQAQMEVTVNIRQSDFPDGVLQLLNRMSSGSIQTALPSVGVKLILSADLRQLPRTPGTQTLVSATLQDEQGIPIVGQQLTLLQGPEAYFMAQITQSATDSQGKAYFRLFLSQQLPPEERKQESIFVTTLVRDSQDRYVEIREELTFDFIAP